MKLVMRSSAGANTREEQDRSVKENLEWNYELTEEILVGHLRLVLMNLE